MREELRQPVIVLRSAAYEKWDLGEYSTREAAPVYEFTLKPSHPEAIGIYRFCEENESGKFQLVYYFQSYSMETIKIYPRRSKTAKQ